MSLSAGEDTIKAKNLKSMWKILPIAFEVRGSELLDFVNGVFYYV